MDRPNEAQAGHSPPQTPRASMGLGLDPSSPWAMAWPSGLFVAITFFVGADMAADLHSGIGLAHLAAESVALLLCLLGSAGSAIQLRRALYRANELEQHLHGTRADLNRWRGEAEQLLGGLGAIADTQFERWGLTAAQREVALLILKGLSYKEVADLRSTAEHTVRNQALAIYRKAGLANRAEMAAFFLEDLMAPQNAGRRRREEPAASMASAPKS